MKKGKLILTICLLLLWQNNLASDFLVNGIGYTVTSFENLTVAVDGLSEDVSGVVNIPSKITYKDKEFTVTSIKSMMDCNNIESVKIPSTVTSINEGAFAVSSIKELIIPDNVKEIGKKICLNCCSLISVKMSSNVRYIPHYSFKGCYNLKNFEWHPVSTYASIGPRAFESCTSLTTFTIPSGVTSTGGLWDGSVPYKLNSFYRCTSLESLILEDSKNTIYFGEDNLDGYAREFGGSSIKYLYLGRDYAANYFNVPSFGSVEKLIIGDTVSSLSNWPSGNIKNLEIGSNLSILNDLSGNTTLESIKIKCTTPPKAKGFSNFIYLNTLLYVPKGCKAIYESSGLWKYFLNIQEFDDKTNILLIHINDVKIHSQEGVLNIQGVVEGIDIIVYSLSGQVLGYTRAMGNRVSMTINSKKGELVIVRIGNESIKILM